MAGLSPAFCGHPFELAERAGAAVDHEGEWELAGGLRVAGQCRVGLGLGRAGRH